MKSAYTTFICRSSTNCMTSAEQIQPSKLVDIVYHFTDMSVATDFGQPEQTQQERRIAVDTGVVHPSAILVGVCDCCGDEAEVLKCLGCKNAQYCSTACQCTHWETHQEICEGA